MNITIISQAHCESCTKVRAFVAEQGLIATVCSIDHQGSTELRRFLDSQHIRTVPAVFINGEYIGGYEATVDFLTVELVNHDQYSFGQYLETKEN